MLCLNLGCGLNPIKNWINYDSGNFEGVVSYDLRQGLPQETETVSYIYAEHFIEHIPYDACVKLLSNCYKVLKRGGIIRLSTPDLEYLVKAYQEKNLQAYVNMWSPETPCKMMNEGMRLWGHEFIFDKDQLQLLLNHIGFEVTFCNWGESKHESLKGIETRPFRGEIIVEGVK
jgi:predicted SAM-dependent methyltransferase